MFTHSIMIACAVIVMVAVTAPAQTTWFVDDDNCPGPGSGTQADPFCSIQDGIDTAAGGDKILIAEGTYYENVVVDKPIALLGASRYATIIDGSGTGDVLRIESDTVTVRKLGVTNSGPTISGGSCDGGIDLLMSDHCEVDECLLFGNAAGISIANSSYNRIANCAMEDNTCGIFAYEADYEASDNAANEIRNNVMRFNMGAAICFQHTDDTYHQQNVIHGNDLHDNGSGIWMIMSEENDIAYNEIVGNAGYGISITVCVACGSGNVIHHNNFVSNHGGDVQALDAGNPACGDNYWYSVVEAVGNHWSDYEGPDFDGDGIGDVPYELDTWQNPVQDPYPLMHLFLLGDTNCDAQLDGLDIGPFVLAMLDPDEYESEYGIRATLHGDINSDGELDVLDIEPFLTRLMGD